MRSIDILRSFERQINRAIGLIEWIGITCTPLYSSEGSRRLSKAGSQLALKNFNYASCNL